MRKKINYIILSISTVLILAACSSNITQLPSAQNTTAQDQQQNPAANSGNQSVESNLAVGLLKLEDTPNAITGDQAKTLLPLWQAVKALSSSNNTTEIEMNALYQQIQESLSAEQLLAIKEMNLQQSDIQALMTQYNIQPQQGAPENVDPNALATRIASRSSTGAGGPPDGGMPGGGGGPGSTNGQSSVQRTPQAGQTRPGGRLSGGMNSMFADPLIELLIQRSAS